MNEHMSVAGVAAQTTAAVHRRDHRHDGEECHPHAVEVVHLGSSAVVVCHDCGADTGFVPQRYAAEVAAEHRAATVTATVPLPPNAA